MTVLIIAAVCFLIYDNHKFIEKIHNEWYEGSGRDD
jgi:hypothetical protein